MRRYCSSISLNEAANIKIQLTNERYTLPTSTPTPLHSTPHRCSTAGKYLLKLMLISLHVRLVHFDRREADAAYGAHIVANPNC